MGTMKAYPVVYSRTKNADFVPDFLARPEDFNYKTANKFVESAMRSLDLYQGIRYAIFNVGDYCVCGGIASVTQIIAQKIGKNFSDKEYLHDKFGREIVSFIGLAVKKSDWNYSEVPSVSLQQYWEIYLDCLKKQWNNTVTKSIPASAVEIETKAFIPKNCPVNNQCLNEKNIVFQTDFDDNQQELLDYYFYEVSRNNDCSFVSGINRKIDFENNCFQTIAMPKEIYNSIKASPTTSFTKAIFNTTTTSEKATFSRNAELNELLNESTHNNLDIKSDAQKKTAKIPMVYFLSGIVAIVIITILLLVINLP